MNRIHCHGTSFQHLGARRTHFLLPCERSVVTSDFLKRVLVENKKGIIESCVCVDGFCLLVKVLRLSWI